MFVKVKQVNSKKNNKTDFKRLFLTLVFLWQHFIFIRIRVRTGQITRTELENSVWNQAEQDQMHLPDPNRVFRRVQTNSCSLIRCETLICINFNSQFCQYYSFWRVVDDDKLIFGLVQYLCKILYSERWL